MSGSRIAVLGAGANGASIGADLTRAGVDVIPTPVNAAVTKLAHRIERHELAPDPSNLPLLLEAAGLG